MLDQSDFSILLTELNNRNDEARKFIDKVRTIDPLIDVIVLTTAEMLQEAILAIRAGKVNEFLIEPIASLNAVSHTVDRVLLYRELRDEKDQLKSRLFHQANRLQNLIKNNADAILSADADGTLTYVNPAAKQLLGDHVREGQIGIDCLPKPLSALISNWQTHALCEPIVAEISWPANMIHMVRLSPNQVDVDGRHGWIIVICDITHVKQFEDFKMKLLQDTIGNIRAPIAQSFSTLLELYKDTPQEGNLSEGVQRLATLLRNVQNWSEDLVSLTKIQAGSGMHFSEIDLAAIIEASEPALSRQLADDKNMKLRLNLDSVPPVQADQNLLQKLLPELVQHVAQRTIQGSEICLSVGHKSGQVWIEVSEDMGDTAEGIPTEDQVFQDFASPVDIDGGKGIHWAMVKAIVNQMGGQVWVRHHPGGSVTVSLPQLHITPPSNSISVH
jgi:two-component system sensor histidine kinase ResE